MKKVELNPIQSALDLIYDHFEGHFNHAETIALDEAIYRTLAEDVISKETIPAFSKSTVDGYAVNFFQTPRILTFMGKVDIGSHQYNEVKSGQCMYVPTGAMIPHGTDTMVMIEDTDQINSSEIRFKLPAMTRENIIEAGDDMTIGKKVLVKGTLIKAHEIGALASMGIFEILVYKKPKITLLSTGDELIDIQQTPNMGQIREINTYTLTALATEMGLKVIDRKILKDDYDFLKAEFAKAIEASDLVIVSGGSSVGEKDYTYDLLNEICDAGVLMNGMAIKPGKPTIIAKHQQKPIIGLPGHPVSAIVVFNIIVAQIMRAWGFKVRKERTEKVKLTDTVYAARGRDTYQMVTIVKDGDVYRAHPTSGKSGTITLLTGSNGYVVIPKELGQLEKDTEVTGYYFF